MGKVTLIQPTAISCMINCVFPSFTGIQAGRAGTLLTLSRLPVESSMRLFFKPVIMFRTSLISSLRALATRTLPSCSSRTPSSPTLCSSPLRKTPQVKVRGVWSYSSFEASCDALLFLEHRLLHFAQYTFTMSWPKKRDASTDILHRLHGYMKEHKCRLHWW